MGYNKDGVRIDVHSHFIPDFYREALLKAGISKPDGMPFIPAWSTTEHLKFMADLNITKSILSISSPGFHFMHKSTGHSSSNATIELVQKCNSFAATLKRDHLDKFGYFQSLPLPDVEASVREIEAEYITNPDGIAMLTNYDGLYQGDQHFAPLYQVLNRRKALVFLHPTGSCSQLNHPGPMYDFLFDTAKAVINLMLSGSITKYPDISWIITHAGGALPSVLSRFTFMSQTIPGNYSGLTEEQAKEFLRNNFYFDLAGWPFEAQILALMDKRFLNTSLDRVVYGSDYPFTPAVGVELFSQQIRDGMKDWKVEGISKVMKQNAENMLKSSQKSSKV